MPDTPGRGAATRPFSARGFQEGDAIPVIACTATASNITVIGGGILVFDDALAGGAMLAVQLAPFALVAVAALERRRLGT